MHSATAALVALSIALGGCSWKNLGISDYPLGVPETPALRGSIKDDPPKPAPAKTAAVDYRGIAPTIDIVNADTKTASRLARAMFHELNLRGHVKPKGNWTVIGAVDGETVRWRIKDQNGKTVADIDQQGLSDAAVAAIVAGVTSYLQLSL
jgi:hypothetical protein